MSESTPTGQRPLDLWQLEKEKLTTYRSIPPYQLCQKELRKVSAESFVHWGGSRYSVPPQNVGQTVLVEVRAAHQQLVIRSNNLIVAEHHLAPRPGSCVTHKAHLDELWKLSLATNSPPPSRWQVTFQDSVLAPNLASYEEVVK